MRVFRRKNRVLPRPQVYAATYLRRFVERNVVLNAGASMSYLFTSLIDPLILYS